jgi:hypothetical protein
MSVTEITLILFGGLAVLFGTGELIGHLTGLDKFIDKLSDSMHQL